MALQIVRSHERMDYKRCPKKWFWKWRKGLVLKRQPLGALLLGTWIHEALAHWYARGFQRRGSLASQFLKASNKDLSTLVFESEQETDKALELQTLGRAMTESYEEHYGTDPYVNVIGAEIPLEFTFQSVNGLMIAHRLKPDLVYFDQNNDVWLMEHKTAVTIRTGHLVIDDQARPYGAMATAALIKAGVINSGSTFKGIMYNFLRKAFPDEREKDSDGRSLNRNGTISKRQPQPLFKRHPVILSNRAKTVTLNRVANETALITLLTQKLRDKEISPKALPKTPHYSCERTCNFFRMCVLEEEGADIVEMQRSMYNIQNPYHYDLETTDEPVSFEMG